MKYLFVLRETTPIRLFHLSVVKITVYELAFFSWNTAVVQYLLSLSKRLPLLWYLCKLREMYVFPLQSVLCDSCDGPDMSYILSEHHFHILRKPCTHLVTSSCVRLPDNVVELQSTFQSLRGPCGPQRTG